MFSCEITTEISASADVVWQVLTDFEVYSEWNPFVRNAEGVFALGETFGLEVQLGDETWNVKQKIVSLLEGREYSWTSRSWYVLLATWGVRTFTVEALDHGRCRLIDREDTRGPLAFVVKSRYGDALEAGITAAGQALKARAEAIAIGQKEAA